MAYNIPNQVKKYTLKCAVAILMVLVPTCMAGFILVPLDKTRLSPPQAYRFYDRNNRIISILISKDEFFRMHVPLDEVPELFTKTLLLMEDRHFYRHLGINPFSIMRAMVDNIRAGHIVSGGSTITMQLARMMDRRDRTLRSKLIEAVRSLKLEYYYSKDEILAYYLALAPYGGNVEGVQSAAYKYFGKPASALSTGEIALLVGLPRSPNTYRPDRHPEQAGQVRNRILARMLAAGYITDDQFRRSRMEPIVLKKTGTINLIPHTAWHYRLKKPDKYVWHTTIDEIIQQRTHSLLVNYIQTLEQYNITNASAVVIDNKTREVRAIVGSLDYFSREHLGANDGSRSPRSPGSTLKPFLYGLAVQKNVISEKTVLYDIPINYAGYAPMNFSKHFIGPVSAHEALTDSLNVVAVRLSKQLGVNSLYSLLKDGGISTLDHPSSYYGLPLVLGGAEIKLIELVNLYASLADKGVYRPYKLIKNTVLDDIAVSSEKPLLSEEAAWLITHILTDVERPDFPASWQFTKNRPTIAWKTGTSYGQQDAWGIGYTPQYTIGVWTGNFNGAPSRGLGGSKTVGPILFDLFQALQPSGQIKWYTKPEKVKTRDVCVVSGLLPSRYCKATMKEYYIDTKDNRSMKKICTIHQAISIDKTTLQQASKSTSFEDIEQRIYAIWPPEMAAHLLRHGVPVDNVPPYDVNNMAGQKYYPPVILSPVEKTVYYQRPDKLEIADHGIKLSAAATNRVRNVFWFLDDALIGRTHVLDDVFINPGPGNYRITLMDDVGGIAKVHLCVKDYRDLKEGEPK